MAEHSNGSQSPEQQVRALYEQAETGTADALKQMVDKASFGRLLALSTENLAALTRIGYDLADLVLRNLRLAGRADITRLARQLHRTEDKLERVLQEVEALRDELAGRDRAQGPAGDGKVGGTAGREPDEELSRRDQTSVP